MICKNCGAEYADGVKFCAACGTSLETPATEPVTAQTSPPPQAIIQNAQPQPAPIYVVHEKNPTDSSKVLAIISLVTGILALITSICCLSKLRLFSLIPGVTAIICGAISKSQKKQANGMATAGLILGIAGTVLGILIPILLPILMIVFSTILASIMMFIQS